MPNENLDALTGQIDSFPSLPSVVARVIEITGNKESSANELVEAILPDQSMCATILKIANSAFFGLPREVNTMEKAVMVLGFNEIRNIVIGKAVCDSFDRFSGYTKKNIETFWAHSFNCGLAAKILAERINLSPSEMFIAGLIHDIGKLVMLITLPNIYPPMLKLSLEDPSSTCAKEQELFIICHDELALKLLVRWLFPSSLATAVGYHHRPAEAPTDKLLCSTVQIADTLTHILDTTEGESDIDFKAVMLNLRPDLFDLWIENGLPCSGKEVKIWVELLQESRKQDSAILSAFAS